MKIFSILVLAVVLFSCSKEVELDQPSYKSKVVVDGYIETGRSAHIHLTMSSPYLIHYDSVSILNTFLNHAKITLLSSKGEEEILTIYRENRFFPPFVYKSVQMKGEEGVKYDLIIEVDQQVLTASTTIPSKPEILDTRFVPQTDSTGYPEYKIAPPQSEKLYLFPLVQSTLSKESFHPTFLGVDVVSSDSQDSVWKRLLRVREMRNYASKPKTFYYHSFPKFQYDLRDTIWVAPGAVDSISYRVLKSLFTDLSDNENPFAFNGNRIETNIQGGLGRWTGIGTAPLIKITSEDFN